ncbi:hypothetical protein VPHPS32B4_0070 [Vibrio phage PS32B-4]
MNYQQQSNAYHKMRLLKETNPIAWGYCIHHLMYIVPKLNKVK